jgi:hypothetical protein
LYYNELLKTECEIGYQGSVKIPEVVGKMPLQRLAESKKHRECEMLATKVTIENVQAHSTLTAVIITPIKIKFLFLNFSW